MEASQDTPPAETPAQDQTQTGSQDAGSGDAQSSTQTPADSQQTPTQDSQLQTPQADQPIPTEEQRAADDTAPASPPVEDQGAPAAPAYPSSAEQQAAHDKKQADLEQHTREHNERTGGGTVQENELQAQRDEHNARTAGETVTDDGGADSTGDDQSDSSSN